MNVISNINWAAACPSYTWKVWLEGLWGDCRCLSGLSQSLNRVTHLHNTPCSRDSSLPCPDNRGRSSRSRCWGWGWCRWRRRCPRRWPHSRCPSRHNTCGRLCSCREVQQRVWTDSDNSWSWWAQGEARNKLYLGLGPSCPYIEPERRNMSGYHVSSLLGRSVRRSSRKGDSSLYISWSLK